MSTMNVYNFYHMTMPQMAMTKYDSHKKSELRSLYNDMIKLNQKKPFYKLSLSDTTQSYVIGIKEAAMELKTSSAFLSEDIEPTSRKMAITTDAPADISVKLLTKNYSSLPSDITLQVNQLAVSQKNTGTLLPSSGTDLPSGTHYLTIEESGSEYQFEIETKNGESNLHIQRRLAMSINNSGIGIRATVVESGLNSALQLEYRSSGTGTLDQNLQFIVKDERGSSLVDTFGLNQVTDYPANAEFILNGDAQTASSNHISINNGIGIELYHATGKEANIRLAPDYSALLDDVDDFVSYYNHLIELAHHTKGNPNGSKKLLHEIGTVTRRFHNSLEASGLTIDAQGYLQKDEALLVQSTENGNLQDLFHQLSDFNHAINETTKRITLNPMEYVDKTIISYPNTRMNFPNPYMPSIYSGMLFNQYV
ncbi:MAG: flagellar filament capping protein FliD [Bacteroides sp.]|nr:flagellar filament capping protein FliD [Bacteroides sp.]MCM1550143.1 flagellar filament capping protein FliD [Clostridium sp.]